jgi:hypothetical protein
MAGADHEETKIVVGARSGNPEPAQGHGQVDLDLTCNTKLDYDLTRIEQATGTVLGHGVRSIGRRSTFANLRARPLSFSLWG